jgi:predicted aminopeptidase
MQRDLNNSHLALIATYQDLVPTFMNLLTSVDGDMQQFYQLVKTIGEKDKATRTSLLAMYKGIKTSSR